MKKINIRGIIGRDINPEDIEKDLKNQNESVDVTINSPGGLIYPGIEIFNMFKNHKGDVKMHISGLAGSMASYIALAGKGKPTVEKNSTYFIHNAQGVAAGDHNVMLKFAKTLENISNVFAREYSRVSGKNLSTIKNMMDVETDIIGEDIVKNGFAASVIGEDKIDEDVSALAKLEMEDCIKFIKANAIPDTDIDKIAALLSLEPEKPIVDIRLEPEKYLIDTTIKHDHMYDINPGIMSLNQVPTPAKNAGKNITEVKIMNFNELMAANPAANTEFVSKVDESKKAGYEAGKAEALGVCARASVFATSKDYPDAIKMVAIDVMCGKKSMETLEAMVASADMYKELQASTHATNETATTGATQGQQSKGTPDDMTAMLKKDREALGLEVK